MTILYQNLKNRISEIEKGLKISNDLDVEDIDSFQEITKAYILLVHAELEKYFEIISVKVIHDSVKKYNANGLINKPLLAMMSSNIYSFTMPENFDDSKNKEHIKLTDRIRKYLSKFINLAYNNNGIKATNIFKMFWVIGFAKDEIGNDLLVMLEEYGTKRGSIAHTGLTVNKTLLNYNEEKENVKKLINEIEKFDKIIDENHYLNDTSKISEIEAIIYRTRNKEE